MNEIKIIAITEVIGTIAFSVSGSLIAIRRYLDLFGVIFVGCITSVGGGILRDIFLGKNPPSVFSNPLTLSVAAITSITVFIICYLRAYCMPVPSPLSAVPSLFRTRDQFHGR